MLPVQIQSDYFAHVVVIRYGDYRDPVLKFQKLLRFVFIPNSYSVQNRTFFIVV